MKFAKDKLTDYRVDERRKVMKKTPSGAMVKPHALLDFRY